MRFEGSYTEGEPNFPRQNNIILQKMVSGVNNFVNFKDFSRPNKETSTFQGPKRIQGLFKTTTKIEDLFKSVRTMLKTD